MITMKKKSEKTSKDSYVDKLAGELRDIDRQTIMRVVEAIERLDYEDTGFKDQDGKTIYNEASVIYDGDVYDVALNPFNDLFYLDNDMGAVLLKEAHGKCKVI